MTTFKITKVLAYAAFLWLIISGLVGSVYGFGLYCGLSDSPWLGLVSSFVSGGIALIFAKEMKVESTKQAGVYSLLWLIVPLVLDLFIIYPLSKDIFSTWQYWLGHGLVFVAPWVVLKFKDQQPLHV